MKIRNTEIEVVITLPELIEFIKSKGHTLPDADFSAENVDIFSDDITIILGVTPKK